MHSCIHTLVKVREVNCAQGKTVLAAASSFKTAARSRGAWRNTTRGDFGQFSSAKSMHWSKGIAASMRGESKYVERRRVKYSKRAQ
jgi:hypothetical protein